MANLPAHASEPAEPITGRASVIDGDIIDIAGTRIRFNGIDAPESWQKCQDEADSMDARRRSLAASAKDHPAGAIGAATTDAAHAFMKASAMAEVKPEGQA